MVAVGLDTPRKVGPEAFMRFFDPATRATIVPEELTRRLVEKRRDIAAVPSSVARGLGDKALHRHIDGWSRPTERTFDGAELLAYETSQLNIGTEQNKRALAHAAGVTLDTFTDIEKVANAETEATADALVKLVEKITADKHTRAVYSRLLGVPIDENISKVVLAGLLTSGASHEGQTRQNRDRPYFTHPLATALLYQMAWEAVASDIEQSPDGTMLVGDRRTKVEVPDKAWLEEQLFVNLLHDVIEDQIKGKNQIENGEVSFLEGDTSKITPLLMQKVLTKLGKTTEQADHIVDDILLVTKTRDPSGGSLSPSEYVHRCTSSIRSMIAKFCDTVHNKLIDPKTDVIGFEKTKGEYETMIKAIEGLIHTAKNGNGMRDDFGLLTLEKIMSIVMDTQNEFAGNHENFMRVALHTENPLGRL